MIKQLTSVGLVTLMTLPRRWGSSLVVIVSIAGVVAVMVSVLAMARGFEFAFSEAGHADRAVVLRNGDESGMASAITRDQLPTILGAPGIARDADGKPIATAVKFMTSLLTERGTGSETSVVLRGVGEKAWSVWPEVRIVEGRAFKPGLKELVVGRKAQQQFVGLELGSDVALTNGNWKVVGVFEAAGSLYESELWGDAEMVFAGYSVTGQFSSVVAEVAGNNGLKAFKDAITTNPALSHTVKGEPEYLSGQLGPLPGLMRTLGYVVAVIMGLGALFACVNTMYAALRARTLEIATLRAIGFGSLSVLFSVLIEALVLCLAGAVLGCAVAYLGFNGFSTSTVGTSGAQVAFAFKVDASLLLQGTAFACAIGVLSALPAGWRATRLPVATALRLL